VADSAASPWPWEQVTGLLVEGLVAGGADPTPFATLDSNTAAHLDGVCPHGYADDPSTEGRTAEATHVPHVLARSGEFDIGLNQRDWFPLAFAQHCRAPLVETGR
jgi:hypothetical protein